MKRKPFLGFLILIPLSLMVLPASGLCELKNMDDTGLSDVYAEGFTTFTIKDLGTTDSLGNPLSETEARFNIQATTYTTIDSLKLGYHNQYNYKDPTPGYAWDEDWTDVTIGGALNDPTLDFLARGFYFKAVFANINNSATRQLKSVSFGADYVKGDITAVFNNFSGTINDGVGAPEYNGHDLNLGLKTITADPATSTVPGTGGLNISFSIDTYDKGYWVKFDNAIVKP